MIAFHREHRADLTIACLPVPQAAGPRVRRHARRRRRPRRSASSRSRRTPPAMPDNPDLALASMGIYVFATDVMYELLFQDAARKEASGHDFGKDIIPAMLADSRVFAYPFRDENRKQAAYWRDVGTLDAYLPDQHGPDPGRPDPEPLRPRLADPHLPAADAAARSSSTPTPTAGARPSTRSSARGRSSRAARSTGASSRRASGSTATPWSRTRSSSTASRSAATPGSAGRSSTRTSRSPPASRSAGTARPTSPAA